MGLQVITGANRGIGLELVKQLRERGGDVVALCRKPSPELVASGVTVEAGVDLTQDEGIAAAWERLRETSIDLLVHNAGLLANDRLETLDVASVREQIEVNAVAPLRLTAKLLPALHRGSKIAIVTSRMGSLADNGSGGSYGYRMSKAAVNMAGLSLARDLKSKGIAVALVHPGFVRTAMTGFQGHLEPAEAASLLLARIDQLSLENSGTFWHANGEVIAW